MKTLRIVKNLAAILLVGLLFNSCDVIKTESMGDAGQTLVKMFPAGFQLIALDAKSASQKADMFEVRKDAHSAAALNSSTTVVLMKNDAILTAYNEENETALIPLPTTLATTTPAAAADGKVTLDFAPGEFAKTLVITIPDATKFDFSKQYGLAYKVLSVSGAGTLSKAAGDEIVVQVLVKNKYDGLYEVTANSPMVDVVVATLSGNYPFKYKLETTGAHTVDCIEYDNDYPLHPILSGTSWSYYGSFCPQVEFKSDGSGEIVKMTNYWGNPAGNTRGCLLDASQKWAWNPSTRNVRLKYYMTMTSAVPTPPHIRTTFDETWKYLGPR